MKRVLDLIVASVGLVVLAPLWLMTAAVIAVTDGRPILFLQTRMGRHRSQFKIVKFRTMIAATVDHAADLGSSARVTRVGGALRRWKLDEIPQLWNVVRGDMSMVGPRPELPEWVEVYPVEFDLVLRDRPGVTDPASLEFRNEELLLAETDEPHATYRDVILPRKLKLYLEYQQRRNLASDLVVLCRTVAAVVVRR